MPQTILDKIKFLCMNIPKVEWSGVLFYTIKGSIKNPATMVITLKDILPMDKGTKAYTEYELDERFEEYLMENPKRMEYLVGHIHSHNDMNVYFSGTDMSELNDNSAAHNFYLSLIVNNFMEFCAKVAFRATARVERFMVPYKGIDENGEEYEIEEKPFVVDRTVMYVHDCLIDSPQEKISVNKSFRNKVTFLFQKEAIEKQKKENEAKIAAAKKKAEEEAKKQVKQLPVHKSVNTFMDIAQKFADTYSSEPFKAYTDLEQFVMALFNFSNSPQPEDTFEGIMSMLEDYNMNQVEIAKSVLELYTPLYAKFFPDRIEEQFVDDTVEVIEMLEEEELVYPILTQTIEALKILVLQFEKHADRTAVQ